MGGNSVGENLKDLAGFVAIDLLVSLAVFVAYKADLVGRDASMFVLMIFWSGTVGTAIWMLVGPRSETK